METQKQEEGFVKFRSDSTELEGILSVPEQCKGIVLFAHGSGSSRHSPRNNFVAEQLRDAGLGTLLFDLLTIPEEALDRRTAQLRFDIDLLTRRLVGATRWLQAQEIARGKPLGYFGASTGAAAALKAAAEVGSPIRAVVSRGGRPDLAGAALGEVKARVLLIVGGLDLQVLELNQTALSQLRSEHKEIGIVEGASHLFEEPGALAEAAGMAREWLTRWLA